MIEPAEDRVLGLDSEGRVFDIGPYGSISTIAGVLREDYPNCWLFRTRETEIWSNQTNKWETGYHWVLNTGHKDPGWIRLHKDDLPKPFKVYLILGD